MKTLWFIILIIASAILPLYATIIIVNYLKYQQFTKLNLKLQLESDANMYYWWFYNPELKGVYKKRSFELTPFYERRGKNVFTFYQITIKTFIKKPIFLIINGEHNSDSNNNNNMKADSLQCIHKNLNLWYNEKNGSPNNTIRQHIIDFLNQIPFPLSHHYELEISNNHICIKYLIPINTNTKREKTELIIEKLYQLANNLEQIN